MHKYERFIIYPLLILALFYGMAGDQVMTSATKVYDEIIAKKISIVDDNGKEIIKMGLDRDFEHSDRGIIKIMGSGLKGKAKEKSEEISDKKYLNIMEITNSFIKTKFFDKENPDNITTESTLSSSNLTIKTSSGKQILKLGKNLKKYPDDYFGKDNDDYYDMTSSMGLDIYFKDYPFKDNVMTKNSIFSLISTETGVQMNLFNAHGDDIIKLGKTTNGHGGIWIYDKYGENSASYGHNNY